MLLLPETPLDGSFGFVKTYSLSEIVKDCKEEKCRRNSTREPNPAFDIEFLVHRNMFKGMKGHEINGRVLFEDEMELFHSVF